MKYDKINTIFPLQKKLSSEVFSPFFFSFSLEADANPFQKRKTERQDGRVGINSVVRTKTHLATSECTILNN